MIKVSKSLHNKSNRTIKFISGIFIMSLIVASSAIWTGQILLD